MGDHPEIHFRSVRPAGGRASSSARTFGRSSAPIAPDSGLADDAMVAE